MTHVHPAVGTSQRGQATELSKRLGNWAQEELQRPICAICSTQTSYSGPDLQLDSQDSDYKWWGGDDSVRLVICLHDILIAVANDSVICSDPRQYIGTSGQKWTTLAKLHIDEKEYHNDFAELIPGKVWSFKTRPSFGIGQRAFLMKDPVIDGLVMWDCVAYIDDATINKIDELSGGKGISHMIVSHPHYYSTTAIWTAAFPNMKLWLAEVDFNDWHQRQDLVQLKADPSKQSHTFAASTKQVELIKDEQTLLPRSSTTKILLLGGHFPGSLVLLWEDCLFIADTIQVVPSGLYKSAEPQRPGVTTFSFMWSYPDQIPLSAAEVMKVCQPLENVSFNKAFGAFEGFDVWGHAKEKVFQSRDIVVQRLQTQ